MNGIILFQYLIYEVFEYNLEFVGFFTIFCRDLQIRVDASRIVYVGEFRLPNDSWME
jgi:hypothetical protein